MLKFAASLVLTSLLCVAAQAAPQSAPEIAAIKNILGDSTQLTGVNAKGEKCQAYFSFYPDSYVPGFEISVELSNETNNAQGQIVLDGSVDVHFGNPLVDQLSSSNEGLSLESEIHYPAGRTDFGWPTPPYTLTSILKMDIENSKITRISIDSDTSSWLSPNTDMTCNF